MEELLTIGGKYFGKNLPHQELVFGSGDNRDEWHSSSCCCCCYFGQNSSSDWQKIEDLVMGDTQINKSNNLVSRQKQLINY